MSELSSTPPHTPPPPRHTHISPYKGSNKPILLHFFLSIQYIICANNPVPQTEIWLGSCSLCVPSKRRPLIYCNSGFTWVLSPRRPRVTRGQKRRHSGATDSMVIEVNGERMANTGPGYAEIFRTQGSCKAPCSLYLSNCSTYYCMSGCVNVSNSEHAYLTGSRIQVTNERGVFHPLLGSCPSSEMASTMNY